MTKNINRQRGGNAHGGGNGKRKSNRQSKHNTSHVAGQPIFAADGKTVIGRVVGDVFTKRVRQSRHMLRTPPAWAIDVVALDQLHAAGAVRVVIQDVETGKEYSTSLAHFERHCSKPFNRGFGRQVFLTLGHWHVDGQPSELGRDEGPDPNVPRQLPLFAEGST